MLLVLEEVFGLCGDGLLDNGPQGEEVDAGLLVQPVGKLAQVAQHGGAVAR